MVVVAVVVFVVFVVSQRSLEMAAPAALIYPALVPHTAVYPPSSARL
jgi:hypothetical protein